MGRFSTEHYSLDSEDQMALRYGGINHFFWITEARTRDTDILADLRKRLKKQSFTDLLRWAHRDEMGFKSNREVATELFHLTNVMPYLGDRHTSEFFGCYITSKAAMKKYAIIRTTVAERRKKFEQARSRVQNLIREGVADASLKRSRETAADIIDAHWTGRTFVDVGNVPNIGQITNLPMGSVVETAVRIDRNGFQPLSAGTLPPIVQTMVEPYSRLISLLVDACLDKNVNLARQALRMDPVVGHLATASVNELADRLLGAHKSFLGWLH